MVSKSDANRYLITPEVIDYLFKKASPGLSAKDRKIFEDLTKSMRAFADKRAGGHVLTDPDLLQEVIKRFNKVGVGDSKDLIKAIMSIPKVMEQVEGKTSKAFQNAVEKSFTKALITLPEDYLKSIKELNTDVNSLNKNIERLIKSNDAKANKIVSLKNTHSADTASLREKHANEISELKGKHQKNIDDLKEKYEGKISNLQDAHAVTKRDLAQEKELVKLYEEEVHDKEKEIKKEQAKRKYDGLAYAREDERKNKTIEAQAAEIKTLKDKLLERNTQHGDRIDAMKRRLAVGKNVIGSLTKTVNKKDSILGYTSGELAAFALRNFAGQKGLRIDSKHADYKTAVGALAAHFHNGGKRTGKDIEQLIGHLLPNFTRPDGTSKLSGKGSGSGGSGGKGGHVVQQLQKFEKAVVKNMKLPNPTSDLMKSAVLLLGSMNPVLGAILTALLAIRAGMSFGFGTTNLSALSAGVMSVGSQVISAGKSLLTPSKSPVSNTRLNAIKAAHPKFYAQAKEANNVRRNYRKSTMLSTLAKKIPGWGILAGAGASLGHFAKGDTVGGIGELASGLLGGMFPGLGTALSTGIDTWLGARENPDVRRATSSFGKAMQRGALKAQKGLQATGNFVTTKSQAALTAIKQSKAMTEMAKLMGQVSKGIKGIGAAIKLISTVAKTKLLIILGIAAAVGILAMWIKNKFFGNKDLASTADVKRYKELHDKKLSGGLTDEESAEYKTLEDKIGNLAADQRKKLKSSGNKGLTVTERGAKKEALRAIQQGKDSKYLGSMGVESSQLFTKEELYNKGIHPEKLSNMAAERTGAYERVQDLSGYWTVARNQFALTSDNKAGSDENGDILYNEKGTQANLKYLMDNYGLPKGAVITSAMRSGRSRHSGHTGRTFDITYANERDRKAAEKALAAAKRDGVLARYQNEYTNPSAKSTGGHFDLEFAGNVNADYTVPSPVSSTTLQGKVEKAVPRQTATNGMREALWNRAMGNDNAKLDKTRNILFSATDITGSLGVWGITRLNSTGGA